MNLCISLFWLRWAESTTRLGRPIWKSWSVVSESAMLCLQDEFFATLKDISQILRQCNCHMQAFPPKAVKHMSWNSHNISSCDIYKNYIGNCLMTRMVAILFFIACEKYIPPFLLLVKIFDPRTSRPVMHQYGRWCIKLWFATLRIAKLSQGFRDNFAIYVCIDLSEKPPRESVKAFQPQLRRLSKCRRFHFQYFLLWHLDFFAILGVMEMQFVWCRGLGRNSFFPANSSMETWFLLPSLCNRILRGQVWCKCLFAALLKGTLAVDTNRSDWTLDLVEVQQPFTEPPLQREGELSLILSRVTAFPTVVLNSKLLRFRYLFSLSLRGVNICNFSISPQHFLREVQRWTFIMADDSDMRNELADLQTRADQIADEVQYSKHSPHPTLFFFTSSIATFPCTQGGRAVCWSLASCQGNRWHLGQVAYSSQGHIQRQTSIHTHIRPLDNLEFLF